MFTLRPSLFVLMRFMVIVVTEPQDIVEAAETFELVFAMHVVGTDNGILVLVEFGKTYQLFAIPEMFFSFPFILKLILIVWGTPETDVVFTPKICLYFLDVLLLTGRLVLYYLAVDT